MNPKLKSTIKTAYQTSKNSIQDIARIYGVSVPTVLDIIDEGSVKSVHINGDLIDQAEAGPDVKINLGEDRQIPFTAD